MTGPFFTLSAVVAELGGKAGMFSPSTLICPCRALCLQSQGTCASGALPVSAPSSSLKPFFLLSVALRLSPLKALCPYMPSATLCWARLTFVHLSPSLRPPMPHLMHCAPFCLLKRCKLCAVCSAVVGEVDDELDAQVDYDAVRAAPLKPVTH